MVAIFSKVLIKLQKTPKKRPFWRKNAKKTQKTEKYINSV